MRTKGHTLLLAAIIFLAMTAGAVLLSEGTASQRRMARSAEFQMLVRGLGFGPALDLSECPFGFDPRLGFTCQQDHGPIPGGGAYFCPHHACSIFYYPSFEPQGENQDRDVEIP